MEPCFDDFLAAYQKMLLWAWDGQTGTWDEGRSLQICSSWLLERFAYQQAVERRDKYIRMVKNGHQWYNAVIGRIQEPIDTLDPDIYETLEPEEQWQLIRDKIERVAWMGRMDKLYYDHIRNTLAPQAMLFLRGMARGLTIDEIGRRKGWSSDKTHQMLYRLRMRLLDLGKRYNEPVVINVAKALAVTCSAKVKQKDREQS